MAGPPDAATVEAVESRFDPQPAWADQRLIGHRGRKRRDGTIRLEEMEVGNGAVEFKRFVGTRFVPGAPELPPSRLFHRCTFIRVGFCGALELDFLNCRFIDCQFLNDNAAGHPEPQILHFSWCELNGDVMTRGDGVFSHVELVAARFENCMLSRIRFKHRVSFREVRLVDVRGLPSCVGLDQVEVTEQGREQLNTDLADVRIGVLDRFASWERLRTFGRLPLFGTSLTALVAIPVLFYGLALYNAQIERLQRHAPPDEAWSALIRALEPLPVPALSLWLLLSTLLLGVAAMLFALLCPPRVREFSLERWTDELRQPATRYLPASWSRRWARAIAAPCYIVGGGGTLLILLVKLWNAGEFIIRHSTLPW